MKAVTAAKPVYASCRVCGRQDYVGSCVARALSAPTCTEIYMKPKAGVNTCCLPNPACNAASKLAIAAFDFAGPLFITMCPYGECAGKHVHRVQLPGMAVVRLPCMRLLDKTYSVRVIILSLGCSVRDIWLFIHFFVISVFRQRIYCVRICYRSTQPKAGKTCMVKTIKLEKGNSGHCEQLANQTSNNKLC